MKRIHNRIIAASLSAIIAGTAAVSFSTSAIEVNNIELSDTLVQAPEVRKVVTEYSDLWTGTITFKTGEPVQWYVHVPEGTEPKGCGATIKIPFFGIGSEEKNKDEEHITLTQGDNFIYEFTPEKAGDHIFNCWMGSGCHHNYIHITDDGTYSAQKPADPTNLRAKRSNNTITVSFDAPTISDGAQITGYRIIATDSDGKKTKKVVQENSAVLEDLNAEASYTINVYTLATSGTSDGEGSVHIEAVSNTASENNTESPSTTVSDSETPTENKGTAATTAAPNSTAKTTSKTTTKTASTTASKNKTSPQTGDNGKPFAVFLLAASLGATLLFRKRHSND